MKTPNVSVLIAALYMGRGNGREKSMSQKFRSDIMRLSNCFLRCPDAGCVSSGRDNTSAPSSYRETTGCV